MKYKILPSGSYRTQIRKGDKRISVTAKSVSELKKKVAEYTINENPSKCSYFAFKDAIDKLIGMKSNTLKKNTLSGYNQLIRQCVPLYDKDVNKLSENDIQTFMNAYAANHSPHSCRNLLSFIMQVIKHSRADPRWNIKLPQQGIPDMPYPDTDQIQKVLASASDPLKKGILICAFAPARRGEACAIKYKDIDGNVIHIHATMAKAPDGSYFYEPTPKTAASDRFVSFPDSVIDQLGTGEPEEYVVGITPQALYNRWRRELKKLGLPPMRLHSTRAYGASLLHDLGKSDAYIQKRGGWSSASTMQRCYRKSLAKDDDVCDVINDIIGVKKGSL